MVNLVVGCC